MAENENIGGISVQITGDLGPLQAIQGPANALSAQIGASTAAAFNTGAVGADQFSAAIEHLAQVIREQSAASSLATQRNMELGRSLQQVGQQAAGAHLNTRFLIFGLKDLAEGRSTYAMAEMVNVLSRLGPIAIAGGVVIAGLAAAFYAPIAAAKALQKEIEKIDAEVDKGLEDTLNFIERANVIAQTQQFGAAAGKKLEGIYDDAAYHRDLEKVHALSTGIQELVRQAGESNKLNDLINQVSGNDVQKQIVDKMGEQQKLLEEAEKKHTQAQTDAREQAKLAAEQAGSLTATKLEGDLSAFKRTQEQKVEATKNAVRAQQEAQQLIIDGHMNEYRRAKETGELEAASARELATRLESIATETANYEIAQLARIGAARSAGKDQPQQRQIAAETLNSQRAAQDTAQNVYLTQGAAADRAAANAPKALIEATRRETEALNEDIKRMVSENARAWQEGQLRVSEYVEKVAEAAARVREIEEKGAGETAALKLAGEKSVLEAQYGAIKEHSYSQQIEYEKQLAAIQDQEYAVKLRGLDADLQTQLAVANELRDTGRIAQVKRQIADLEQQQANAAATSAAKQAAQTPRAQIAMTLQSWNARGIQDAALAVAIALEKIPQEIGDAIAQGLFQHQKGQSVPSAIGKDIVKALEGGAKSLAGELLTIGLKSAIAHIIPSLGKVLSGASQIAAQAAANAAKIDPPIVAAVDRAAARIANAVGGGGSQKESGACAECCQQTNQLLTRIAGSAASQTVELGAMATSLAVMAAIQIAGIFAHAGGTDSAPGGLALIGEKGPEIMHVPRGAQIIPNHKIKAYADGIGGYSSHSSSAYSQGDTHITMHVHNPRNGAEVVDHVMRNLPGALKRKYSGYSPASH